MRITKYIGTFIITALCIAAFVAGSPQAVNAAGYEAGVDDMEIHVDVYKGGKHVASGARLEVAGTYENFTPYYDTEETYISTILARTPRQALESSTVKLNLLYDYNGDGKFSSSERIRTITYDFTANTNRQKFLSVAEKAVKEYKTSSYWADLWAIKAYMYNHFEYSGATRQTYDGDSIFTECSSGANLLQTWSDYKYHIPGTIINGGGSHVLFSVDGTKANSIDAAGHHESDDFNEALSIYELNVKNHKAKND